MNKPIESLEIRPPIRKKLSHTQSIDGAPDEVFPLLCPVLELDWAPGWDPDWVLSRSGVVEENCIFQTPGDTAPAIWVVTRHDPAKHQVEMIKVTPDHTVGKLRISLAGDDEGGTRSSVSYEFTAIGPAGEAFLEEFTEDWYLDFMRNWENAMNHYLRTGALLA